MSNKTDSKQTKATLVALATDLGLDSKGTKAQLAERIQQHQEEQQGAGKRMSAHLRRYRATYQPSKSATGNASAHNGDDLATLLAACTPVEVARAAEKVLALDAGTLVERYGSLNPGQVRMNSGNRIRAAMKRNEATTDDVAKAIAALN